MKLKLFSLLLVATCLSSLSIAQSSFQIDSWALGATTDIAIDNHRNVYAAHAIFNSSQVTLGMTRLSNTYDTTHLTPPDFSWCSSCVARIDIDEQDNLFYVSYGDGHIGRYDAQGNHQYLTQLPGSFGADYATRLTVESDTSLLVSTRSGAYRVNTQTSSAYEFLGNGYDNLSAFPADDGTIWQMRPQYYSSPGTRYLLRRYSYDGVLLSSYDSVNTDNCSIYFSAYYKTFTLAEAPNDDIWYASCETGLLRLNPSSGIITPYWLNSDSALVHINDIAFDDHDNAWVASDYGLFKLNTITGQYLKLDVNDGLPTNRILSLAWAGSDTLWIGHDQGISRIIDPTTSILEPSLSSDWTIYPNPTEGVIHIKGNEPVISVVVTDLMGRTLYRQVSATGITRIENLPRYNAISILHITGESGNVMTTSLLIR